MQARTRFFPFFLAYLVFLLYLCGMIGKRWIIGCWIVAMGLGLMACAPQAVREAQSVVAQADCLWHAGKQYGIDEGDSATLAQASPLDATSKNSVSPSLPVAFFCVIRSLLSFFFLVVPLSCRWLFLSFLYLDSKI